MDLQLAGKRALVTGASRGLGYATAKVLACEGVAIALNSHDEVKLTASAEKLAAETHGVIIPIVGDMSDPAVPETLVAQAVQALGGLDLLFTNSGGPPPGKFEAFDDAAWQKAIELMFLSHVRLIRAALPHLRQSPAPSVLTVTSLSVKQPIGDLILSNSIRAATIGLTKSLALDLGAEGIRFNSILPAWTKTERVYNLMTNRARINGTSLEQEMAKQAKDSPMGRLGEPEEFANVAVFLLSPAASYLTGVMLSVDGGMYKGIY